MLQKSSNFNKQIKQKQIILSMKANPTTKIQKNKLFSTKTDYSHIKSRLYSSLSKSKSKSKQNNNQKIKTVRYSLQKAEQIGEAKYKEAMKHMKKFNQYEKQKIKRQSNKHQLIDKQCTFKPKINHKKYSHDASFATLRSGISSLYGSKSSLLNKSQIFHNNKSIKNSNILIETDKQTQKLNKKDFRKKPNVFQTSQRLLNWGKTRDIKIINKAIEIEASRSISKQSTYSCKNSSNPKSVNYKHIQMKKLNLTISTMINESQQSYYKDTIYSTHVTPKTCRNNLSSYANKSSASLYYNSSNITPRGQTMKLNQSRQQQVGKINPYYSTIGNTQRANTEQIDPQKFLNNTFRQNNYTYGQKLLAKQADRGQGSFYLRQAKANIMKNYNKCDVLRKDKKYTKNFSIVNNYKQVKQSNTN